MIPNDEIIFEYAMQFLGAPYKWGGDDPNGWDCSGLVIELLQAAGVLRHPFDANAQGLYRDLLLNKSKVVQNPQYGAVVFFGKSLNGISHVGFCLSSDLMIEAGGGDSTVVDAESAAKKNAFVKVRPISHRIDKVAYVLPTYPWS